MRRVGYAPPAPGSSRREYGLAPNELKFNAELRVALPYSMDSAISLNNTSSDASSTSETLFEPPESKSQHHLFGTLIAKEAVPQQVLALRRRKLSAKRDLATGHHEIASPAWRAGNVVKQLGRRRKLAEENGQTMLFVLFNAIGSYRTLGCRSCRPCSRQR